MSRVLVTGSAGYLGRATVGRLAALGDITHVVGWDLRPTPWPIPTSAEFTIEVGDVAEKPTSVLARYRPDTVIHLAFTLRPPRNRRSAHRTDVEASAGLATACVEHGVGRFVFVSSTTVYGAYPDYHRPYVETDPLRPVPGFVYAEHKAEAEQAIAVAVGSRVSLLVLRCCVVMGPGASNFITDSLDLPVLPVPGRDDPPLQFLHVDDFLSAIEVALTTEAAGVFNIAGRDSLAWRSVVSMAGARPVVVPGGLLGAVMTCSWALHLQSRSPAPGLSYIRYPWMASTARARELLRWEPDHSAPEAVAAWAEGRGARPHPPDGV